MPGIHLVDLPLINPGMNQESGSTCHLILIFEEYSVLQPPVGEF